MTHSEAKHQKKAVPAIRSAVSTLFTHKEIMYPFAIIAFVQLLVLEVLYFYPRFPLNKFFGPLVSRLWSPNFLHYPANLELLPKLFQTTQVPIYILISSFFIAVAIGIITAINRDERIQLKSLYRQALGSYVHLVVGAGIMFLAIMGLFNVYDLVYERALIIGATAGWKFWIKVLVLQGAPYFQFLISVFVTAIFVYLIPIIMIDRKNVFAALIENFKALFRAPVFTFLVVLLPSLLYVIILLIRVNLSGKLPLPELSVFLIVVNILVLVAIDAIVYTAITIDYLLQKETK